ncbi:MAG: methyltransferase domain-containing protein [Nanoarchaeota archaeon]
MKGYDILGNIAIVKFDRKDSSKKKKKESSMLMKQHKNISTVLEKSDKFSGRLRTLKTKHVLGVKTKEVVYRENDCTFRFNVDSCYFSPRLSNERVEIAEMVKPGERVLVMCSGVGPFAIVIAKLSEADEVVSVELSRECNKYALDNVKRNKVQDVVEIVQGDVRKVLPKLKEKFDRIVMTRPNLKDDFLDVAFLKIRKNGFIHYYGFYEEDKVDELKKLIVDEAKKAKKKVKILKIKKAGDIGMRKYRYRVDFRILN